MATEQKNVAANPAIHCVFFESQNLCYNYKTGRWSKIPDFDGQGYHTLNDANAIIGQVVFSGNSVDFQTSENGVATDARLETGAIDPNEGGRFVATGVRPLISKSADTSIRVRLGVQDALETSTRTNLLLQSEDFSTTWSPHATLSITTDTVTAPDGTTTADKLFHSSGQLGRIGQTVTVTQGETYTFSVYLKRAGFDWVLLQLQTGDTKSRFYDLKNGALGGTDDTAPQDSSIELIGDDWFRCSITDPQTQTTQTCRIWLASADGAIAKGNAVSGLYAWGAQMETGLVPTSYIKTTTATASESIEYSLAKTPNASTGLANTRLEGRYHRADFVIGGGFETAIGFDVEGYPQGNR